MKVPHPGRYRLILNSDDAQYQGSAYADLEQGDTVFWTSDKKDRERLSLEDKMRDLASDPEGEGNADDSALAYYIDMPLPPLAGLYLVYEGEEKN